eukprot:snap_masked-scaffold_13-processed-gene-8.38-mRNA-1 protein AED:1.00 eAED:1.00 QI:0/-1/0/0/-1/1/1/0/77
MALTDVAAKTEMDKVKTLERQVELNRKASKTSTAVRQIQDFTEKGELKDALVTKGEAHQNNPYLKEPASEMPCCTIN